MPTAMVDVDDARLADGLKRATEVVTGRIKIGRATTEDLAKMLGLLSTSTSHDILADRDVVIEAITENEAAKADTYNELAGVLKAGRDPGVEHLDDLDHPDGRVGPAPRAIRRDALLQPGRPDGAGRGDPGGEDQRRDGGHAWSRWPSAIRKTPIVVSDCAGFLVNRVLFPYMNEALLLLQEGAPMDAIDEAATGFGMPMGPIALARPGRAWTRPRTPAR